jgi:hypothetical protein
MSEQGIFVQNDAEPISDDNNIDFDSRRAHLLIDLNYRPKRFDVIRLVGTALSRSTPGETSETLFSIEHGLPFIPKVETYIYVDSDAGFDLYIGAGSYFREFYPYSGSGGGVNDIVRGVADATHYKIIHTLSSAFNSLVTSTAPSKPIKVKYEIFSNEAPY